MFNQRIDFIINNRVLLSWYICFIVGLFVSLYISIYLSLSHIYIYPTSIALNHTDFWWWEYLPRKEAKGLLGSVHIVIIAVLSPFYLCVHLITYLSVRLPRNSCLRVHPCAHDIHNLLIPLPFYHLCHRAFLRLQE